MPRSSNEPAPLLLRLPPFIRDRIYRFVGLVSWDGSPFTFDLQGPGRDCRSTLSLEEPYPDEFYGLLLSCHRIYTEAAALLYSVNRFVLYYTNPGSLAPLAALTTPALSSLTALKIVLNQASCHPRTRRINDNRDCCLHPRSNASCKRFHHQKHQLPLLSPAWGCLKDDDSIAAAQALLAEWRSSVSYLSSRIVSGRMELSLVCDIDPRHEKAVDVAIAAVEPLRLLPLLRCCHIRLGKTPDPRIGRIAQDAALQSCGIAAPYQKPTPAKPTFVTLPRELRLRILEYTDLVTPSKEVWWSRQNRKYQWADIGGRSQCFDNSWSRCEFSECWYRSVTYDRTRMGLSIGCFCRRRHSAFSSTCTCWAPPGPPLFLICRSLCEDARLVFFSANRFVVHDYELSQPWCVWLPSPDLEDTGDPVSDYPYERFAASQFLHEVVPTHYIAHLRFLEVVSPPYPSPTWPQTNHPAMRDWRETVGWLRDNLNGPVFTLRLVVAERGGLAPEINADIITAAEGDTIQGAYIDLLQPLKQLAEGLNGLARFYADLAYPWQWTQESMDRWQDDDGQSWLRNRKMEVKRNAEQFVMGDRFDELYANGREEPKQSLWQHVCYDHY